MRGGLNRPRLAAPAPKWRHLVTANMNSGGNPFSKGSYGDDQISLVCCAAAQR